MFISTQAMPQIAEEFLDEVLVPKAAVPIQQFALGFMRPYIGNAVKARVDQYMPLMVMLTIADANGKIDLDRAHAAAIQQADRQGGSIQIGNYRADKADIDALYEIAKRHATTE